MLPESNSHQIPLKAPAYHHKHMRTSRTARDRYGHTVIASTTQHIGHHGSNLGNELKFGFGRNTRG